MSTATMHRVASAYTHTTTGWRGMSIDPHRLYPHSSQHQLQPATWPSARHLTPCNQSTATRSAHPHSSKLHAPICNVQQGHPLDISRLDPHSSINSANNVHMPCAIVSMAPLSMHSAAAPYPLDDTAVAGAEVDLQYARRRERRVI